MQIKPVFLPAVIFFLMVSHTSGQEYLQARVKPGEGAYAFLERFGLGRNPETIDKFKTINNLEKLTLIADRAYKLPVKVYSYNGVSIRSTLGTDNWDYAVSIQKYNDQMHSRGTKSGDYRKDKVLWVPDVTPPKPDNSRNPVPGVTTLTEPLFGADHEKVTLKSTALTGHVYYLVSGHGGPDPGAMANLDGHTLCEDEYAYDISLRLARNLMEHNATVYIIIRDPDDGIRKESFLKPDKDEVCYPDKEIPINQIKRLNQRANAINTLYNKHKKEGAGKQRTIIIHVDSRGTGQRIDMFFYHKVGSDQGKKLAESLQGTIAKKYAKHQQSRGYTGTVNARNLHMLRETYPIAVYAELGNIRNTRDQKRFIIEDNRQAVANWLCEGILNDH